MRRSTALILAAITLSHVACGDDGEPEPEPVAPAAEAPGSPGDTVDAPQDPAGPGDPGAPATPPGPARPGHPDAGEVLPDAGAAEGRQLFTVQVAAFTNRESAELWTERLGDHGLPVWTSVTEMGGRTFYRVRIGAAPTVAGASRLGRMLGERYQWPVWVAPVTPADRPPRDAVETTRRLTGES